MAAGACALLAGKKDRAEAQSTFKLQAQKCLEPNSTSRLSPDRHGKKHARPLSGPKPTLPPGGEPQAPDLSDCLGILHVNSAANDQHRRIRMISIITTVDHRQQRSSSSTNVPIIIIIIIINNNDATTTTSYQEQI